MTSCPFLPASVVISLQRKKGGEGCGRADRTMQAGLLISMTQTSDGTEALAYTATARYLSTPISHYLATGAGFIHNGPVLR